MAVLVFFSGLTVGLLLLVWQRSRADARIRSLVRQLGGEFEPSLSSTSQLGIEIAHYKELHHHLEDQIATYRQILQAAPIGYLQVDDENRLIGANLPARRLLGIAEESPPVKPRLLMEVVRSYELDDLIDRARQSDKPCQSDWTFYSVSNDPVKLSEPRSFALRGYGFPLMERQVGIFLENRQESLMLTQQRDRWTSDLAHELKTPLTSIRLVAETLQSRVDPSLKIWCDRLIQETIRLSTLVQDLLELNQITIFKGLQLQTTNLVDLIHSVWHSLEPLARRKGLSLDYQGPAQLLLPLDAARIHRLLVNLLDNSIKFSPAQQAIAVKVGIESDPDMPEEKRVCLEVIDAGIGFPEAALPHVFERFYRVDPSRSRSLSDGESPPLETGTDITEVEQPDLLSSGSGLGLAIAQQIVEIHQGKISASNHPDTGGAWMRVYLPIDVSDPILT